MKKSLLLFIILFVLLFVLIDGFLFFLNKENDEEILEREFPEREEESLENNSARIFFPEYISSQNWKTDIADKPVGLGAKINCQLKEDDNFHQIKEKTIDGQIYCIEEASEGAAGSIYTEYTYSTLRNDSLVSVSFVARYVQCYNYPEPRKTECEEERENFSFDNIVDKVANNALNESLKNHQEEAIINYLLTQKEVSWQTQENSHRFCSIENLAPQKELFPYYIWVYCGEYIIEDGQLKELSGASLPAKINYPNELSFYDLSRFSHEIPLDGADYGASIKEIFPEEVQREIADFRKEGRVKKIIEKNEDQAWVNILTWEAIKLAIEECRVEEAFQAHSRRVEVNLKNGEKLVAVEPKIDQIMLLAEEATPRCGEIIISTE